MRPRPFQIIGRGQDDHKAEVKIGTAKQTAVRQMLMGLTPTSWKSLVTHMSMMQGEPQCEK